MARTKGINNHLAIEVVQCHAQPELLSRVLDNLYSNAVHYGQESGNIWIRSRISGQYIVLELANSGMPIAEADSQLIFKLFYQGSIQHKDAVKGSRLGLSIARDCIRRMRGELDLVRVDYVPVCFRITLPLTGENR